MITHLTPGLPEVYSPGYGGLRGRIGASASHVSCQGRPKRHHTALSNDNIGGLEEMGYPWDRREQEERVRKEGEEYRRRVEEDERRRNAEDASRKAEEERRRQGKT